MKSAIYKASNKISGVKITVQEMEYKILIKMRSTVDLSNFVGSTGELYLAQM